MRLVPTVITLFQYLSYYHFLLFTSILLIFSVMGNTFQRDCVCKLYAVYARNLRMRIQDFFGHITDRLHLLTAGRCLHKFEEIRMIWNLDPIFFLQLLQEDVRGITYLIKIL